MRAVKIASLAIALVLFAFTMRAQADDCTVSDALKFHVYATGVQIYRWDGTKWVFNRPSAKLYADPGYHGQVGIHYLTAGPAGGPTWESNSGSKVIGIRLASCPAPASDQPAIAWLKLAAKSSDGPGVFDGVTFIQRVLTHGGVAPSFVGTFVNQEEGVPYTAEYFFYSAND